MAICDDSFFTINLIILLLVLYYFLFGKFHLFYHGFSGKINIRNNIENIKKDKDLALETILNIQIRDCIDKWCVDRLWKLVFKLIHEAVTLYKELQYYLSI